ncbi:hypothetical protein H6F86_00515 [Phormidium sp. FACHB-592]|uniref:CopG family transcriptional regulator n=1 Tax=Stenomitos frigidus AS-A4 TaxID=2933935 RepID=A0ABV0KT42_9CYAN|nr:hypothetical protein [Phormidium sp. FACHB-592]MBD2072417.1 hypothetical protein [Phormidium sp. FACHB-592]
MVEKRSRIAKKPPTIPPIADAWVTEAGLDPELQSQEQPPLPTVAEPATLPEKKGKPYPHRISFDMETQQYKRLKRASFETDQSMNELLREAAEDWLRARGY